MTSGWQQEPDVFEIFPWNRNFETGIEEIDEQHKNLVDIVNRLAYHLASTSSELDGNHTLDELLAFAAYHFQFEETVWKQGLGDSSITRNHHDAHQMFFVQIQMFRQSAAPGEQVMTELLDYLARWLAFHILESDRRMALSVKAMAAGATPDEARDQVDSELSGSMSVLVNALLETYGRLSASTIQLMRERIARLTAEDELHRLRGDYTGPGSNSDEP